MSRPNGRATSRRTHNTLTERRAAAVLAAALLLVGCARSGAPAAPAPGHAIAAMLDASADAWNRGDLAGFLDDYADSAAFVTSSGIIHGRDAIERRYQEGYWSGGGPPDLLSFEDIRVTPLGADHALAVGRYILKDRDEGAQTATGIFTLILVRTPDGWRIIHDHSSATG